MRCTTDSHRPARRRLRSLVAGLLALAVLLGGAGVASVGAETGITISGDAPGPSGGPSGSGPVPSNDPSTMWMLPGSSPLPGDVIWSADHETGDLSQWTSGQNAEAVFNTGTGAVTVSSNVVHGGRYALKLSVEGASGEAQAARIFRWHENRATAFYSAWLYVPQVYRPAQWWGVMQFKSRDGSETNPVWVLNVGNRADGRMYLYLWDSVHQRGYASQQTPVELPAGRWVQLTVYYERATDQSGRITVWQNDTLLYDLSGVQTSIDGDVQWSLSNYTDDIAPSDATIYFDDAQIRAVAAPGQR